MSYLTDVQSPCIKDNVDLLTGSTGSRLSTAKELTHVLEELY